MSYARSAQDTPDGSERETMAKLTAAERRAILARMLEEDDDESGGAADDKGAADGKTDDKTPDEEPDEFTYRGKKYRRVEDEPNAESEGKEGEEAAPDKAPDNAGKEGDGTPAKRRKFIT